MLFDQLKRRAFISLLGGAAAWPLGVRAQQPGGMRRIGVLMASAADDSENQARMAAFLQGAIGLDRRPQRADRHPLGLSGICGQTMIAANTTSIGNSMIMVSLSE